MRVQRALHCSLRQALTYESLCEGLSLFIHFRGNLPYKSDFWSWKPPSAHSEPLLCWVSWSTVDEIYNRGSEQIQALRSPVLYLSKDSGVPNILQHEVITQFLPLKFQLSMIFILISSSAFLVWLNQHLCFKSGMTMFQWRTKFIWRIKINFIKTLNRNLE